MAKKIVAYKIYKFFTISLIVLIVINIVSYYFITGPGVFLSQAATMVLQLEIITPLPVVPVEEEVTVTPSPGGAGPIPPPKEIKIFIDENNFPILKLTEVAGVPFKDLPEFPGFTKEFINFTGWTNIKDALIFIQLTSTTKTIDTIFAEENGFFKWTNLLPLSLGSHSLQITALSPYNPEVRAFLIFNFQRVLPPPAPPVEPEKPPMVPSPPTAPPPVIPAPVIPVEPFPPLLPPPPILEEEEIFSLDTRVLNKIVYPRDEIEIETEIIKVKPEARKELNLKYIIRDPFGKIIFEEEKPIGLEQKTTVFKKFKTSFLIEPGIYDVIIQLEGKTKIFTTTDQFLIKGKPIVQVGERVILTEQQLSRYLVLSFIILFLLLILFTFLLYNEYKKAKKDQRVDEYDLRRNGMI